MIAARPNATACTRPRTARLSSRTCVVSRLGARRVMPGVSPRKGGTTMTGTEALQSRATVFEGAQPILRVGDLQTSVDYYVRVLGFKVDFHEIIASVSRG